VIFGPQVVETFAEIGPVTGLKVITQRAHFGSIAEEVRFLRRMVDAWRGRAWTRETATQIVFREAACAPKVRLCHALAVGDWVKQNITYVNEYPETFQTPRRTVELGAGDCDDATILIASLLEAIGIRTEIVGMKVDGKWRHVFPRAIVRLRDGRHILVPIDVTIDAPLREFPDPVARTRARGMKVDTYVV
jgi:hypothetical protein